MKAPCTAMIDSLSNKIIICNVILRHFAGNNNLFEIYRITIYYIIYIFFLIRSVRLQTHINAFRLQLLLFTSTSRYMKYEITQVKKKKKYQG